MKSQHVETPFGAVMLKFSGGARAACIVLQAGAVTPDRARAAVYGAKALGAARLLEVVAARPLDRLLPLDGHVVPHDVVDLTRGHHLTFFAGKGYGFLPQQTPFCPEMRAALAGAARAAEPRSAVRGVYAALNSWEDVADARRWGAHLAGTAVSPTVFLARELEICYVPLCVLGAGDAVEQIITRMLEALPAERKCPCASAMQPARERGLVGDDWRTWL